MDWLATKWPGLLVGIGLILLLVLVTRGNLRGNKPVVGACENCTCGHGKCQNEQAADSGGQ